MKPEGGMVKYAFAQFQFLLCLLFVASIISKGEIAEATKHIMEYFAQFLCLAWLIQISLMIVQGYYQNEEEDSAFDKLQN
tara:strand:- start:524 stop:763 length:240 start_codon:yes stop_codon:yes gene_type:complete